MRISRCSSFSGRGFLRIPSSSKKNILPPPMNPQKEPVTVAVLTGKLDYLFKNVQELVTTTARGTEKVLREEMQEMEKRLDSIERKAISTKDALLLIQVSALKKWQGALAEGKLAATVELDEKELETVQDMQLLTTKKILYVLNVDEQTARRADWKSPLGEERLALPISVKIEAELASLPEDEAKEFMVGLGFSSSGLDKMIGKSYEMLDLVTFLTTGEKETRAWTVVRGSKAPQAAGKIHTDFEKAFIRAEIISYGDFVEYDGEAGAKEKGKLRVEGKEYVMRDGDICNFRVGV